jgi:hypothetical protein
MNWTPNEQEVRDDFQPKVPNASDAIYVNVGSVTHVEDGCNSYESNIYSNVTRADCTEDNTASVNDGANVHANFNLRTVTWDKLIPHDH